MNQSFQKAFAFVFAATLVACSGGDAIQQHAPVPPTPTPAVPEPIPMAPRDFTCGPPATPRGGWGSDSRGIGEPCSDEAPCRVGLSCYAKGTPGSMCYADCTFAPDICPGDSLCTPVGGGMSWCLRSCALRGGGAGCGRPDLGCNPMTANPDDPGVCFPACENDDACDFGPEYHFTCRATGPAKGACVCTRDSDCNNGGSGSMKCDAATGGCYQPCTNDAACAAGGSGGCCLSGAAGRPQQCEIFSDPPGGCDTLGCSDGFACRSVAGESTCVAETPAGCAITTQQPQLTPFLSVVSNGPHWLDPVAEVTFQVPAGSAAWTIVAQGPGTPLGLIKVVDPSGQVLWRWEEQPEGNANPIAKVWAPITWEGTFTYTFPNTSQATTVAAGAWKVTLGSTRPAQANVQVLIKKAGPATGRKVDVNLWVVSETLDVAALRANARWTETVNSIKRIWAKAGIDTVTFTYYDVPQSIRDRFAVVEANSDGPCDSYHRLFQEAVRTAANPPRNAGINFFLVDSITSPNGTVLGIDGTIPGPGGFNGTPASGAIAELTSNTGSTLGSFLGHILAHEGGHFFGLYHTTEGSNAFWDPIADTSACNLDQVSCGCVDAKYLMFPYAGCPGTPGDISAGQAAVVRAAPSVY
jgi:hypothetical protein